MSDLFPIAYPEHRALTASEVRSWYADAVANDELEGIEAESDSAQSMAECMDDAGIITLVKWGQS